MGDDLATANFIATELNYRIFFVSNNLNKLIQ